MPDLAGGLLLTLCVGSAVYGLTQAPGHGWSSAYVLSAAGVTVLAGVATVLRALRHQRPALRLDLFRSRPFAVATGMVMAARQVGGGLGIAATAVIVAEAGGAEPYAAVCWFATAAGLAAALGGLALHVTDPHPPTTPAATGRAPATTRTLEGDHR
ncbi:hypothetical protein [Streptomyces sp. NPDC001741]|uniref:hypothetical protein n=1 Tax=Streptomyces sp. NPDC001741 TaxID=3364605 RepID=UPI00369F73B0